MIELLTVIAALCAVHGSNAPIWSVELAQSECQAFLVDCAVPKGVEDLPTRLAACVAVRAKRLEARK